MIRLFSYLIFFLLLSVGYVIVNQGLFVLTAENAYGIVLDPNESGECTPEIDQAHCDWHYYYPVSFRDFTGKIHIVYVSGVTRDNFNYRPDMELELLYHSSDLTSLTQNRFFAKWGVTLSISVIAAILAAVYLAVLRAHSDAWIYRSNKSLAQVILIFWLGIAVYELATSSVSVNYFRPNEIIDVRLVSTSPALLDLQVTYYYNGRYGSQTGISSHPGNRDHQYIWNTKAHPLQEGKHTVHFQHTLDRERDKPICTEFTQISMFKYGGSNFLDHQADHHHCWEFTPKSNISTDCTLKTDQN